MTDHVAAHELKLYIDNDGDLYRQQTTPIMDNLLKKKNAGTYSHAKAKKLWEYLAEAGAKKYAKEFGGPVFPPAVRRQTAEELADDFEAEWRAGGYRERQYALETKAQKKARMGGVAAEWARERSPAHVRAERERLRREAPLPGLRRVASDEVNPAELLRAADALCKTKAYSDTRELLTAYWTFRKNRGTEPRGGDAKADKIARKLFKSMGRERWNKWILDLEQRGQISEARASMMLQAKGQ